jgi:hypothetical protein
MMDAPYYNGDYDVNHPSVPDHPSEVRFAEAEVCGLAAIEALRTGGDHLAVEFAVEAANAYHEALREAGECPECGSIFTDPWGRRHYNQSLGCCIEPPERTFDEALGVVCDARERDLAAMRLKR